MVVVEWGSEQAVDAAVGENEAVVGLDNVEVDSVPGSESVSDSVAELLESGLEVVSGLAAVAEIEAEAATEVGIGLVIELLRSHTMSSSQFLDRMVIVVLSHVLLDRVSEDQPKGMALVPSNPVLR